MRYVLSELLKFSFVITKSLVEKQLSFFLLNSMSPYVKITNCFALGSEFSLTSGEAKEQEWLLIKRT